jgi:outer membrane protein OmpA-like peptidoglycan-associated protein
VPFWTLFRDFKFEYNRSDLTASQMRKVSEVAQYMQNNPSLKIAIDGSMDPRGADPRNTDLRDQRIDVIREALIAAGVPAGKIKVGAYGDNRLTHDRRVAVLVCTAN